MAVIKIRTKKMLTKTSTTIPLEMVVDLMISLVMAEILQICGVMIWLITKKIRGIKNGTTIKFHGTLDWPIP